MAMILEIIPGFFGLLGIGWLYAGNAGVGVPVLIGALLFDAAVVCLSLLSLTFTAGIGCLCVLPMLLGYLGAIAFSGYKLNQFTRQHPETFGA